MSLGEWQDQPTCEHNYNTKGVKVLTHELYTGSSSPPYRIHHLLLVLAQDSIKPGLLNVMSLRSAKGGFGGMTSSPSILLSLTCGRMSECEEDSAWVSALVVAVVVVRIGSGSSWNGCVCDEISTGVLAVLCEFDCCGNCVT